MRRIAGIASLLSLLPAFLVAAPVQGAEFLVTSPHYFNDALNSATIEVTGEIIPGDLEKLVAVLAPIDGFEEGFWDGGTVLALDSPGGSYLEGLKIGRLIREKGIGTRVLAGAGCYSACAIVFMHGTSRADGEEWLNRKMHPSAKLGFHAPYLVLPEDTVPTREMVEASYAAAMLSIAGLVESAGHIFSEELLMKMLMTGPNEMLMVETIGDLFTWDIALDGGHPPLISLTYAQMVMACYTIDDLQNDRRPSTSMKRATEIVEGGYGPDFLGISPAQDEIYRFSVNDMNSVGCNLGVGRNDDGSVRVRYYGSSYGTLEHGDPMPTESTSTIGSQYFMDPAEEFDR